MTRPRMNFTPDDPKKWEKEVEAQRKALEGVVGQLGAIPVITSPDLYKGSEITATEAGEIDPDKKKDKGRPKS